MVGGIGGGGLVGEMGTEMGDRTGACNSSWDGWTVLFFFLYISYDGCFDDEYHFT